MNPPDPTQPPAQGDALAEDERQWLVWSREGECFYCGSEADIYDAVFRSMFSYARGEQIDPDHKRQADKTAEQLIREGIVYFEGDPSLNLTEITDRDTLAAELQTARAENSRLTEIKINSQLAQAALHNQLAALSALRTALEKLSQKMEATSSKWEVSGFALASIKLDEFVADLAEIIAAPSAGCPSCEGRGKVLVLKIDAARGGSGA